MVLMYFQEGHIDMLSSDHSPTLPELKLLDDGNFLKAWGGISSLQVGVFTSNIKRYLIKIYGFSPIKKEKKNLWFLIPWNLTEEYQ